MNEQRPPATGLERVREVFAQAARYFVETVALVEPEQWDAPGLGQWSVRDLIGHTSRALLTVEAYLAQPAEQADVTSPVDYFLVAKARGGAGGSEEIARRGRLAGAALGGEAARAVADIAARALDLADGAALDTLLGTPVGGMRLRDYLPTRSFELVVHTLDLAAALDLPAHPPEEALAASLEIATGLALRRAPGADLLLALTGRRPLPAGFSVL